MRDDVLLMLMLMLIGAWDGLRGGSLICTDWMWMDELKMAAMGSELKGSLCGHLQIIIIICSGVRWVGLGWVRAESEQLVVTKPKWILRSGPGSSAGGQGAGAGGQGEGSGREGKGRGGRDDGLQGYL